MAEEWVGRRFVRTPATAPGPLGPQMLKSFNAIRSNPLAYLEESWRRYGDVVQFPVPAPPSYLVNEPSAVRQVLVSNARNYGKSTIQYRSLALVTGEGLLVADTEPWRRQRPMVQPAFHHQTLERIVGHVNVALSRMAGDWDAAASSGSSVDIDAAMMHGALEVVGHALFGTDLSGDAEQLTEATLDGLEVVVARARVPITPPSWLPTPRNRQLHRAVRRLDSAVTTMIAQRSSGDHGADMLDLLLSVRDETGEGLSQVEIRDQVVTFIVAGHETVASALTWAWALLAEHPSALKALQEESDSVLGGREVSFADYERLPFARAVLDETMRLYPPAWLITRKAHEADSLGGHEIPAGALVIMSPWLLHRHPEAWPSPEAFKPERFLDGSADRAAFIPFGAGPRMCIGRDFAYLEAALMLSWLAGRYDVNFPPGTAMPEGDPLVTIRPRGGLRLQPSLRN